MQIFAIVVSLAIAVVGIALFVRAIRTIIGVIKVGPAAPRRTDNPPGARRRCSRSRCCTPGCSSGHWVGIGHWFVFVGFGLLFFTAGHGVRPALRRALRAAADRPLLPLGVGLRALHRRDGRRRSSPSSPTAPAAPRERTRGAEGPLLRLHDVAGATSSRASSSASACASSRCAAWSTRCSTHGGEHADNASPLHFPLTLLARRGLLRPVRRHHRERDLPRRRCSRSLISFVWMITISLNPTMGVAWHRFLAFFNIWFKRESSGRTALGAVKPLTSERQGRSPSTTSTTSTRTPCSASARSRTSPGRASSTSPPAPSAAAASRSAPRGTPRSRSPPSS